MKCFICKKKAKWRFSPDLDIRGIGSCTKHKSDVQLVYVAILQGDEDIMKSMIASAKDKHAKKR